MINIKDYHTLPDFVEAIVEELDRNNKVLVISNKGILFQAVSIKQIEKDLIRRVARKLLKNPKLLEESELWGTDETRNLGDKKDTKQ